MIKIDGFQKKKNKKLPNIAKANKKNKKYIPNAVVS